MEEYFRIDVSEGIDKTSKSKSALFVIIGVFVNKDFKLQPNAYNRCHDLLMISMKRYWYISEISKNETINLIQNADLTEISKTL